MQLSEQEYQEFLRLHLHLSLFAGQESGVLESYMSVEDYVGIPIEEKLPVRSALYENPELIDRFVKQNPFGFSREDLSIINGFKDFVSGKFFIVKSLKKYTIFLHEKVAYGVLGLGDPIDDIVGGEYPRYVNAVLLPYRGKIVYDGIITGSSIYFGGGIRGSINQTYQKAKANYGIVTQLPFERPEDSPMNLENQLAFYMKNAKNREYYAYEIESLVDAHPKLEGKYYWHWGKVYSREKKKWLKELGINGVHYAMVFDTIIAQGKTAAQVKAAAKQLLPHSKHDWVFYFKL